MIDKSCSSILLKITAVPQLSVVNITAVGTAEHSTVILEGRVPTNVGAVVS
jgi:hypothetical protein